MANISSPGTAPPPALRPAWRPGAEPPEPRGPRPPGAPRRPARRITAAGPRGDHRDPPGTVLTGENDEKWWKSIEIPWNPTSFMRFVPYFWMFLGGKSDNRILMGHRKTSRLDREISQRWNSNVFKGGTIFNMLWNLGLTIPDRSHTEGRTNIKGLGWRVQLQGLCARNMADIGPPQLWIWDLMQ